MSKKDKDKYTHKHIIDVIKYRWVWLTISLLLVVPSIIILIYSMITYESHSPMRLGIDFTGGTMLQYGFKEELHKSDITKIREQLKTVGIDSAIIQVQEGSSVLHKEKEEVVDEAENEFIKEKQGSSFNTPASQEKPVANEEIAPVESPEMLEKDINTVVSIRTRFLSSESVESDMAKLNTSLKESFGEFVPLQVSAIGPTLGKELFKNSLIALFLAFIGIVGYLTVRFNIDYAMFALVALFHDAIFVCGAFSLFGLLFGTEVDSLFITAILTVIGFSVHDTIVVFDRVRENTRFHAKKKSFNEIVNISVNQTLARSINTSVTTLITLGALYFLGGVTTKDFVLAMILGILIGTYSSIFNASMLLAWWREKTNFKVA